MLKYKYKAVDPQGEIEIGYCLPSEIRKLKETLQQHNKILLYILPMLSMRVNNLNTKEWIQIFHNLQLLLSAGLPLIDALHECQGVMSDTFFSPSLKALCNDIKQGKSLSDAMDASKLNFPDISFHIITVAESTGDLQSGIRTIHDHLSWQENIRSSLVKSLRYPTFLILIFTLLFYFLNTQVAPQIIEFLHTMGGSVCETEDFIYISNLLNYSVLGIAILLLLSILFYILCPLSRISLAVRDRLIYQIPLVKSFILTRFFQTFSVCIGAHIDLIKALDLAGKTTHNIYFHHQCEQIKHDLQNGQSLQKAFDASNLFPSMIIRLLRVGDITGYLEKISYRLACFLDQRLKNQIDRLIAYLEPSFILCLGGFLLFLVVTLFYPLYEQLSILSY